MIEGPDGQSIAPPKPKKASASSGAQGTTASPGSASFNKAVQQARTERAAAEGMPPSANGYETGTITAPGDTFWEIATSHGDTLPAEEKDNAQIPDPSLIHPGQVVFSPGRSPVSASTTAAIEAAEQSGTKEAWAKAQAGIAKDLETQGANKLEPDKVVQPTVQALDQWAIGSNDLKQATQKAYQQVYQGWQEQGVTSKQIAPILKDRAAAVQDDQALAHLHSPANRAIVGEEQQGANAAWNKVQQDVTSWLKSSVGIRALPEDLGAQRVKELDALFPGDQKFAATNQAALKSATQSWQALGITKDKLDPVLKAYDAYEADKQQEAETLKLPHLHNVDPGAPGNLDQAVNAAQSKLQNAIEQQLEAAAKGAKSPQLSSQAMLGRAAILEAVGPQTADFDHAVAQANTDLQVDKPAEQIAADYRKGGAGAAAKALLTATENAGPVFASQIIAASRPTIQKIGGDLDTLAAVATAPPPPRVPNIAAAHASAQFSSIYGDLSEAVEQTDHGSNAGALGSDTKDAANLVANALAAGYQPSSYALGDPANAYANAAESSIGEGQGANLSLALAGALQHQGKTSAANLVLEGAANGYDQLKTRTDSDVQNFANVTATLQQLRTTWGPFMSSSELSAATAGYIKSNPQFVKQFGRALSQVQQDGAEIFAARQAFSGYKSSLTGVSGYNDFKGAAENLTGDKSAYFAVQESGLPTAATLQALAKQAPGSSNSDSTTLDAPGVARSLRTFANQILKYPSTTVFPVSDGKVQVPTLANLGLSLTGLILTGPTIGSEDYHFGQLDFSSQAVAVYNSLGFGKYTYETFAYSMSIAGKVNDPTFQPTLQAIGKSVDSPIFKGFGSVYYLAGTFANAASASQEASQNTTIAGFDAATALGNFMLAANSSKSVLAAAGLISAGGTASDLLDIAGPVGAAVSAVGQLGLYGYVSYQQNQADKEMQSQGATFLEAGLHLRPGIAEALADVSDPQHEGPAPVLKAYAKQYGIKPESLLLYLNKQNTADVGNFVYLAELMTPGKNGQYPATAKSDTRNLYYIPGIPFQNTVPDYGNLVGPPYSDLPNPPGSLRQMHDWAETIFGNNGPPTI